MKITDKIDVSNYVREEAGQGKGGLDLKPQKSEKSLEASAAELLEVIKLEEADFFTISDELKNVIRSLSGESGPGRPNATGDKDIKAFIGALFKDKAIKGGEYPGGDITEALNSEPLEAGVVSISRYSLLKSIIINGSREPRKIYIPQGTGMSPFLTALLNELFPGWRIRLLKVYRRKRRPCPGRKAGDGEEEGKEPPEKEAAGLNNDLLKGYRDNRIGFSTIGLIRTADKKDLRFTLELNVTPEDTGLRGDGIRLDPITIDYGGPAHGLDDMKFTFNTAVGEDPENPGFSGPGAGCLIIDLTEAGKAGDGSVIYGLSGADKGPWMEE